MLKARQLQLIEELMANPMITDVECGKRIGVNRNTIREWKRQEEFQEELRARIRAKWEDSERLAVETMQNLASEGNFQATKYILDNLGYAATQKIEANLSTDIVINIEE
jgi:hypothetical protein